MMQSVYTASKGLTAQQERIDIIANNISNVNTTAFKASKVSFKDALYTEMEHPDGAVGAAGFLQKGTGVRLAAVMQAFTQGNISETGNSLDFAIEGDGFFRLLDADGAYVYSRNGSFQISAEEDGSFLVNEQGCYVLDENNDRIRFPEGFDSISVSGDGVLTIAGGAGTTAQTLGIYHFPNASGLVSDGASVFFPSPASGEAEVASEYQICQSSLEGSNVALADEFTSLIRAQRLYSISSKALQTADDMEGLAINIR